MGAGRDEPEDSAGTTIALVGLNGAGKTTLAKLLCRMYDPVRGQILWDGTDLRDIPPAALRDRISAVFQDHMHYDMTAAENIGLGDLPALDDAARLVGAAVRAGIHDKIAGLPWGYDTPLTRVLVSGNDRDDPRTGSCCLAGSGSVSPWPGPWCGTAGT